MGRTMRPWAKNPYRKHARKGYCLRPESARSLLHAERFAYAQGRKFTFALTINFNAPVRGRRGKPTPSHYDIFRTKVWHNLCRQWNRLEAARGGAKKFMAIAVFENPPNRTYGRRHYGPLHVHMMLDWPKRKRAQLEFFIRRALRKHLAGFRPHHLNVIEIHFSQGFASYMAKGIDPPYADHFYITHHPQGPINHRRIIISRNLGPAARKKFKEAGGNPLPDRRRLRMRFPRPGAT